MIDPKELRLGNWILSPKGEPFEVYTETFADIEYAGINFNPIPLTPEWLERCGFIDRAGNGLAYRMEINSLYELCWYKQDEFLRYQTIGNGFTRTLEHVKHLHQLQNFFYWHTGQELTIKSFNQSN